jgi:uncharacterized DUF497 family protein
MTPLRFDWDEANAAHVNRHDVTTEEAEQVVNGDPASPQFQTRSGELRRLIIGLTLVGRALAVAYVMRGGKVRIVTAYPAIRKQRQQFEGGE